VSLPQRGAAADVYFSNFLIRPFYFTPATTFGKQGRSDSSEHSKHSWGLKKDESIISLEPEFIFLFFQKREK
jgi:hypothetical protein